MNKTLLQVIGILNIVFGAIFFISIIGIAMSVPLIVSGILFLGYSNLSDEMIEFKIPSIRIWSYIFIFINIISAILGFMFLSQNDKSAKKVDPETFKLNFLLNLGTILILLACIMLINTSLNTVMDYIKIIVLLMLSIIFFIASKFLSKNNKLKYTSYIYWLVGCILFLAFFYSCGYYNLFGQLYSVTGEFNQVFMASLFAIATIILYLSYKMYKSELFAKISFVTLYTAIGFAIAFFSMDIETFASMFGAAILISSLLSSYSRKKTLSKSFFIFNTVVSIGYFGFLMLANIALKNEIYIAIADLIYVINLFVISYKYKNIGFDIFLTVIIPIIVQIYCRAFLQLEASVIACVVSFIIYYLVFYITKAKNHMYTSALITCNVLLFFNYIKSYTCSNPCLPLFISLLLLGIFYSITTIKNYNKKYIGELVVVPFKVLCMCCAVSYLVAYFGCPISFLSYVVIWSNIILMFSIITKNKVLKNIYFTMAYVLLLICIVPIHLDLGFRFDILCMWLIGYILLLNDEKNTIWIKPANIIFLVFALLSLFLFFNYITFTIQLALLNIMMYGMIAYLFKEEKIKSFICLLFMLLPYYSLINLIDINTSVHTILLVLPYLLYIYLFTYLFTSKNKMLSFILEVVVGLTTLMIMVAEGSVESSVTVSVISIIMIILNLVKDTNSLLVVGIATLLLNMLRNMLKYWNNIPIWSYILLGGICLVIIVTAKEVQKNKK